MENGGLLYHEVQEAKLCAVHCVNTVLQGPFFSEIDLAALASDLDRRERNVIEASSDHRESQNVSMDGNFSIQVLEKALEVYDLKVIPLDSPVAESSKQDPGVENAYICHLEDHWFCIRKVNGEWYNFNSLYPAPEHLTGFYLAAFLDSLKDSGWSIFLVRGNFPKESSSDVSNGYGQWLTPEDAKGLNKSCHQQETTLTKSPQHSYPPRFSGGSDSILEQEREDLEAAIQASLMEAVTSRPTPKQFLSVPATPESSSTVNTSTGDSAEGSSETNTPKGDQDTSRASTTKGTDASS